MPNTPHIDVAQKLANMAGKIITKYFRSKIDISDKPDTSPVTLADREVESAIRSFLNKEFPEHGILGEEYGAQNTNSEYVWVIDPIDGTKSFITGKPLFGTLIALCKKGRPIVGIIDQPILKERWVGAANYPTTLNGKTVSTRPCPNISDAWLYATSPNMFKNQEKDAFNQLTNNVKFSLFGADCYAYGLLASGFTDMVCEADMEPYDYCAHVPIIEGAGGKITDWNGESFTMYSGKTVLATGDDGLHQTAISILSK